MHVGEFNIIWHSTRRADKLSSRASHPPWWEVAAVPRIFCFFVRSRSNSCRCTQTFVCPWDLAVRCPFPVRRPPKITPNAHKEPLPRAKRLPAQGNRGCRGQEFHTEFNFASNHLIIALEGARPTSLTTGRPRTSSRGRRKSSPRRRCLSSSPRSLTKLV